MQMLQPFTAPGQRWLHFQVGFAHKYVYYLSAPAFTKMIATDVQTEWAKSTNKWRLVKQALPLFLICFSLLYTQSSGQTGSLWLYVWAANLIFSQGDSCSAFIKGCDCHHLVGAALGARPCPRWERLCHSPEPSDAAKARVTHCKGAQLLKEELLNSSCCLT